MPPVSVIVRGEFSRLIKFLILEFMSIHNWVAQQRALGIHLCVFQEDLGYSFERLLVLSCSNKFIFFRQVGKKFFGLNLLASVISIFFFKITHAFAQKSDGPPLLKICFQHLTGKFANGYLLAFVKNDIFILSRLPKQIVEWTLRRKLFSFECEFNF